MRGAVHVFEHDLTWYRRTWQGTVVSTVLSPVLFLAALGVGLGAFVDRGGGSEALGGVPYVAFIAPALLVSQAMQTAIFETAYPILGKIVWRRLYQAVLATPVGLHGLFVGEFLWLTARLAIGAVAFFAVLVAFGVVRSPLGVLSVPVAVLTGLAFGAPMFAFTCTQATDSLFSIVFRFVITPLSLFAGTYFPIEALPALVQPVAWLTPLTPGVALARSLALGNPEPMAVVFQLAVIGAWIGGGLVAAWITFRRRLYV